MKPRAKILVPVAITAVGLAGALILVAMTATGAAAQSALKIGDIHSQGIIAQDPTAIAAQEQLIVELYSK